MAGFTAQGATFTFNGSLGSFQGAIVGISVEAPTAEVVDMTTAIAPKGTRTLVPTGDWKGGGISVDFIMVSGDPGSMVRGVGTLTFASQRLNVTKRAILESASYEARVGELVRGNLKFSLTDYQGT